MRGQKVIGWSVLGCLLWMAGPAWGGAGDFVIISNSPEGDLCGIEVLEGRKVIACDGAAVLAQERGVRVDYVLGDMDSLPEGVVLDGSVVFLEIKDQDTTDLEKAIRFADEQGAGKIWVINALGGRPDHALYNQRLLKRYYRGDRPILLFSNGYVLEYLEDEARDFYGQPGEQCAVMGMPEARVTSEGLAWDMDGYLVELGGNESACNQLALDKARVEVEGGALLMRPLTLRSPSVQ